MMRYARCARCKNFYVLTKLAISRCPTCVYMAYRCDECGGVEGAWRSIVMHFHWFFGRAGRVGGHASREALRGPRAVMKRAA